MSSSRLRRTAALAAVLILSVAVLAAVPSSADSGEKANNGRLLVTYAPGEKPGRAWNNFENGPPGNAYGVKGVSHQKNVGVSIIDAEPDAIKDLKAKLRADPSVASVEDDTILTIDYVPNDPKYSSL